MGFFGLDGKDSNGNFKCRYGLVGGITNFTYPAVVEIILNDELGQMVIKNVVARKDEPVFLKYSQISGYGELKNLKIENDGSASVTNALVGGFAFGITGAIVGGLSGFEKTKNINKALVIKYHPASNPDEERDLLFEIVQASNFHKQFIQQLQLKTNASCLTQQSQQL